MTESLKRFAVLGYPISHSFSPSIHNPAFKYLDINASYVTYEIRSDRFEDEIQRLKAEDWSGFNVTIPYKQKIIPYLDWIDDTARQIGAINTIKIDKAGQWSGYNTDYIGFLEPIRSYLPAINTCLIIGAGGAAKAIAFGLLKEVDSLSTIFLSNRTVEKAEKLKYKMQNFKKLKVLVMKLGSEQSIDIKIDLIINTTSVGMDNDSNSIPLNPLNLLSKYGLVYDIIYNPRQTRFLQMAKKAGYLTINGWPMLVGQGAASFEIWTGIPFPGAVKVKLLNQKTKTL